MTFVRGGFQVESCYERVGARLGCGLGDSLHRSFPGSPCLCGFALGLFLRNQVAAQQRNEQLRERGRLFFFGLALGFGRLALQLGEHAEERDLALAQPLHKRGGDGLLLLARGLEHRMRERAAVPRGRDILFLLVFAVRAGIVFVGFGVVLCFRIVVVVFVDLWGVDSGIVVGHGRLLCKSKAGRPLAKMQGPSRSKNSLKFRIAICRVIPGRAGQQGSRDGNSKT